MIALILKISIGTSVDKVYVVQTILAMFCSVACYKVFSALIERCYKRNYCVGVLQKCIDFMYLFKIFAQ